LSKTLEFLTNKKFDVEIPKYFLNQLSLYETRMQKGGLRMSSNFEEECFNDDEVLVRNTFLNGLPSKSLKKDKPIPALRRLQWADGNKNKKYLLCSYNNKEMNQKDIKPIVSIKSMKAVKSCLKVGGVSKGSFVKVDLTSSIVKDSTNNSFINEIKSSSFVDTTTNADRSDKSQSTKDLVNSNNPTHIIIAPNIDNIINNNIKNIYINNGDDLNKLTESLRFGDNISSPKGGQINSKQTKGGSCLQNNFIITNMIE
jgi:hypothetical protein